MKTETWAQGSHRPLHPPYGGCFRMRRFALFSALLVALAACGTTGETTSSTAAATTMVADETTTTEGPEFPVMVDAANGEVIVELRPERIVSLAPTATEILLRL